MKLKPRFSIGDLVVIKSYPLTNPLIGEPLNIPPIMVVIGIEIENKNKKTHCKDSGEQIAERIKYEVLWFENKKSMFVSKWVYESFLTSKELTSDEVNYEYAKIVNFKPTILELKKRKVTTSVVIEEGGTEKPQKTEYPLLTFVCPELVLTGVRKNDETTTFDDFGNIQKVKPSTLVKVMWYNHSQQKYSEFELPLEALVNINNEKSIE